MPNADVLALKAQADILFDQVILGYGNNAIEAMGMGIPVIAGVQDDNVRRAMLDRWGSLPWYDATEADDLRRTGAHGGERRHAGRVRSTGHGPRTPMA